MSGVTDLFLVYQFVRRLATPFSEWKAFEQDIIDADGNILKSRKTLRTREEKNAFGVFDVMILNIKKMLEKIPGGKTKLASYAAALYLIREWNHFSSDSLLIESISDNDIKKTVNLFFIDKSNYNILENYVNHKMHISENKFDEDAPANSVGFGNIAGLGVGSDGEPGLTPKQVKRHKKKNRLKYKDFTSRKVL